MDKNFTPDTASFRQHNGNVKICADCGAEYNGFVGHECDPEVLDTIASDCEQNGDELDGWK